jgi:uncharacterized phage-associated protein
MSIQYRPIEVANSFISLFVPYGGVEHMKLQKLLFYAYGWWLAFRPEPLLREKPEVWRYGPVFSSVYWTFNHVGSAPILEPAKDLPFERRVPAVPSEDSDVSNFIAWVAQKYGRFDSLQLSDMTHEPGTPWHEMAEKYDFKVPKHLQIDDKIVRSYFKHLAAVEYPQ